MVREYCKSELDKIEPTIDAFDDYRCGLTKPDRCHLLNNIKIYQLQRYSIKETNWNEFVDHVMSKKKTTNFLSVTNKREYSYLSDDYYLTEFRLILQEYLTNKNNQL